MVGALPTPPPVQVVLNSVKSAIGAVRKEQRNAAQGFVFRGVDAVVNAAAPALNEHGVVVAPKVLEHFYETVETGKNRTPMAHVMLTVSYTFYGPAGDSIETSVFSEAFDSGDKAAAKAMSVAYRIALLQTLNLPTDEPDPDYESYERSGHSTREVPAAPNGRASRPRAEAPAKGDSDDWSALITMAKTVDDLRDTWKLAGASGALTNEVVVDGEKVTVQDLLYRRNDELTAKSTEDAPAAAG